MSRKKNLIMFGAAVLVVLAACGYFLLRPQADADAAVQNAAFTITPDDRTLGNAKAKVVLIEYAAPSCPVCAEFNARTFPALKKNYIDSGKVFYVLRIFPIRPDDGTVQKIAICLPKDRYFAFLDQLWRNQKDWDVEYNVSDVHGALVRQAGMLGLRPAQVDKCIDNLAEDDRINKVSADGVFRYSIAGTPTFVLNGTPINQPSLPDYDDMKTYLDAQLAKQDKR